jgi:protein SCO1/2
MQRRVVVLGATLVLFAVGVIALYVLRPVAPQFSGTLFEPASLAPPLNLTDHLGRSFGLTEARGKIVVMYFGYTHCPDECPLTMAKLSSVLDLLNEDAQRVQVLLVATDPERDTAEVLGAYLGHFHPSFLGLTGSPQELQKVYEAFGVMVLDNGETHSNRTYVIDTAGRLRLTFMYELPASDIAADLRLLLEEG